MITSRNEKYSERITLPITAEMLEQIDSGLGEGEARLRFIRDAISNELGRRRSLTYIKASFERVNGKVFYMLSMMKGADVIFNTSGFEADEFSAVIAVLNYGLDFGVPAVVLLNMSSGQGLHDRVYAMLDGKFEPMVDLPPGTPHLPDVLRAAASRK
jgi:hypothetical protein